jgi:hypothetical protein
MQKGTTQTFNGISVVNGLFTVAIDFGDQFSGNARWLQSAVQCSGDSGFTALSPRQQLTPAPYALSLRPGATVAGALDTAVLHADNTGVGRGLWGSAVEGNGVYGESVNFDGVQGVSQNVDSAGVAGFNAGGKGVVGGSTTGFGVEGRSNNSDGVHGQSAALDGNGVYGFATTGQGVQGESTGGIGVSGKSPSGTGVLGQTGADSGAGVSGYGNGVNSMGVDGRSFAGSNGIGVIGRATDGTGVKGTSQADDQAGVVGEAAGLRGRGVSGSALNGPNTVGVEGISASGTGVHGNTSAAGSFTEAGVVGSTGATNGIGVRGVANNGINAWGVYGQSSDGIGVYAQTDNGFGVYATLTTTSGNLFIGVTNGAAKFRVDSNGKGYFDGGTQNSGADVAEFIRATDGAEPGDVVEIDTGHPGQFRRCATSNSTAVAGVISTDPGVTMNAADPAGAPDQTGPRLALVGRVPVKVTAENGPIRAGDLLVASSTDGHAMRAPLEPASGSVIGKALEQLQQGVGVVSMLVMLR